VSQPKLALEAVRAGYGPAEVLHGIDLDIAASRITVMLGPNGAGKSTTCKTIAGVLPATSGRVQFDGEDITSRPGWWRARRGILLIPESRGIFPGLTVEENLAILLSSSRDRAVAYERFGVLGERRRQAAGTLSGGEQQLLSLAPVIVRPTEVVIADEPTLGLAPQRAAQIIEIFAELRDAGSTVLLVSESPRGLIDAADEVALIHAGSITWQGSPADVTEGRLKASYFGGVG
jgi:ABC-type branched-subunit amino acid transport system ATPase component